MTKLLFCWRTITPLSAAGSERYWKTIAYIRVVGEASNGVEAIEMARAPEAEGGCDGSGHAGTRRRSGNEGDPQALPGTAVLILSMHADDNYVRNALDAGARGYLLKNAIDVDLVGAVKAVAEGRRYLGSGLKYPTRNRTTSSTN